ncbi:MAG TPA: hypothetical protein VK530_02460 [Candidatus Acidoferrum sp.]|nr:hypothetical protein [Candidatus Acidoferrum sp.]
MNRKRTTLRPRFARETQYEVVPAPAAPFRATRDTELEQLKQRLLRAAINGVVQVDLYAPLRRAANEAAAIAWMTPFPLLFFPVLFEEKTVVARHQAARQQTVRARSSEILETIV